MHDFSGPLWKQSPKTLIVLWLALSLTVTIIGLTAGIRTALPGPAARATLERNDGERSASARGIPPTDAILVVLKSDKFQIESPDFVAARESLYSALTNFKARDSRPALKDLRTVGHTMIDKEIFISNDSQSLLMLGEVNAHLSDSSQTLKELPTVIERWQQEHPEFAVTYLSEGTVDNEIFDMIDRDLDSSLIYTIPLTFLVLLHAFGSLVAALIPLLLAIVCLSSSLGAAAIMSHLFGPVSVTASQLVVLLVLAIGVDYSLFIVSRTREEVARGKDYPDAIEIARRTAGTSVLFSGLTVALSLMGLLLMNDNLLTSMAFVSIVAVIITVIGSFGVLPSVLLLLDKNLEKGRLFRKRENTLRIGAIVRTVLSRPKMTLLLSISFLLALCGSALDLKLGSTVEPSQLPGALVSAQAFSDLREHFPDFAGTDFSVIVHSEDGKSLDDTNAVDEFVAAVQEHTNVRGPLRTVNSADNTAVRYVFLALGDGNNPQNREMIRHIRTDLIPKHLRKDHISATLSGTLTYVVDEVARYRQRTPLVCSAVLLLSFLFLLIAFRSLVVPLKALVLNTLSTIAAFGIMVVFFQKGIVPGSHYGVIESFVPPLLFAILFGLSMDYHVFLLSRIREETRDPHDIKEGVHRGIVATSGTITNAAFIMVAVFTVISCLELPLIRELGVGLGCAVLLDATLIRSIILPSSMVLLGSWNWYLPRWLRCIPDLASHSHPSNPGS